MNMVKVKALQTRTRATLLIGMLGALFGFIFPATVSPPTAESESGVGVVNYS